MSTDSLTNLTIHEQGKNLAKTCKPLFAPHYDYITDSVVAVAPAPRVSQVAALLQVRLGFLRTIRSYLGDQEESFEVLRSRSSS